MAGHVAGNSGSNSDGDGAGSLQHVTVKQGRKKVTITVGEKVSIYWKTDEEWYPGV